MDSVWIKTTLSITALICLSVTPTPGQNANATARIVSAANTFLSTLDSQQRAAVLFPFDERPFPGCSNSAVIIWP